MSALVLIDKLTPQNVKEEHRCGKMSWKACEIDVLKIITGRSIFRYSMALAT
jgi:hypothetical protein